MQLYCSLIPIFLCKNFFVVDVFIFFGFLGDCFAKCHTPGVVSSIARKTIDDNIKS